MAGNEFVEQAEQYLNQGRLESAKVAATLASAYEQRTANLIAMLTTPKVDYTPAQQLDLIQRIYSRMEVTVTQQGGWRR